MSCCYRAGITVVLLLAGAHPTMAQRAAPGTAKVSLTGEGVSVVGDYPTTLCGGPYLLGKGMAYQVKAGDYQITVASETREAGAVTLNQKNGRVNVVVTVNGAGKNLVRGPKNSGTFVVSSDFKKAEANLELQRLLAKDTYKLVATFLCQ